MSFFDDNRKIGMILTGLGVLFLFLGVMMFFDRALLVMGNLLFIVGTVLLIGLQRSGKFFFRKHKLRGTGCFIFGIFLVITGWTFFGMLIEAFGILNLFGNFFPYAWLILQRLPYVGQVFTWIDVHILQNPTVLRLREKLFGSCGPIIPTHEKS